MTIINFLDISLSFAHQQTPYKIKGLMMLNLNLQNQFIESNSISSLFWVERIPLSGKHSLSFHLKGDFHNTDAHKALQSLAFINQELELKLEYEKNTIEGSFLIKSYELTSKVDGFLEFEIHLINSNQIYIGTNK
jgi:predicted secreted protein